MGSAPPLVTFIAGNGSVECSPITTVRQREVPDRVFGYYTIRLRNAAANFALLRRFALNLFRLDKRTKKSLPKKRKAAAWNSGYVVDLLNLRPLQ